MNAEQSRLEEARTKNEETKENIGLAPLLKNLKSFKEEGR